MKYWLLLLVMLVGCRPATEKPKVVVSGDEPRYDAAFWKTWGDGQAELTSYDLIYPRYGVPRKGTAVAITVAETFSNSVRVKSDQGVRPAKDEFPVMKLNLVEDFQTGIYDYNLQLSAFVALSSVNGKPAGAPTKVTWSSQEWCGNLFKSALFNESAIRVESHSYFDGEGDQEVIVRYPDLGISEDTLMLWARGMARPVMKPGETRKVAMMLALQASRFKEGPARWEEAVLSRTDAGAELDEYKAVVGKRSRSFFVEKAAPHRVVRYESSEGVKATMLASERMKYWQLNTPEGEKELEKLKLNVVRPVGLGKKAAVNVEGLP